MRIARLNLLFSEAQIAERLDELALGINKTYAGQPLVVICVLKGAFMFFSDLVKRLDCRPELDFVRLASYGQGTSGGDVTFSKDVELSLEGKHVLIVEDIVDTGHSMEALLRRLATRGALSLRVAALLDKHERRETSVTVHFACFSLPAGFVVGYGLDYAEQYRELPALYEAETED